MSEDLWVQEQRWPDGSEGPFTLRLTFGLVDERPEVVGVELWAVDPADVEVADWPRLHWKPVLAPIRTETVRLPIRRLLDDWRQHGIDTAERLAGAVSMPDDWRAEIADLALKVNVRRRGRADAHREDHWRAVADVYLKKGTSGVQETFHVAKGTAAKWVSIARNSKGLLPKTTKGVATGRPAKEES